MFEQFVAGLILVLSWPNLLYLLGGVLLGLWLGVVPGLGGVTGMVLLLPFTFGMEPAAAIAMLLGLVAVTTTSDTISSVMLGIPGTVASQATVLDGHPMARQGRAQTAFGAAFTVSAVGGVIGGLAMAATLPVMIWIVLAFGSPEFFFLALIGLVMVGTVSGNAMGKGICAAAIGLLLSQVGYPVAAGTPRYWFGYTFLLDGLPLVPVVLGLFGIPEMMALAARGTSIAPRRLERAQGDSLLAGIREAIRHRWLALRCALMGTYVGVLPGIGASVVDWLAYGHAVQTARDKSRFGKGDIRGVIGPEAANNATLGGSLIPTVAFGIPGSGAMAILLGAMVIHGFVPGRAMLERHLDITFSMVWTIILANVIGAALLMVWSRQVARAAFINAHLVVPAVMMFLIMGSWLWNPGLETLVVLLAVGLLGYWMKVAGWPRPPLILGFVLGPVMERALSISVQSFTGWGPILTRPTMIALILLLAVALYFVARAGLRRENDFTVEVTTRTPATHWLSILLAVSALAVFAYAAWMAQGWRLLARVFPLTICGAGAALCLWVIATDIRGLRRLAAEGTGPLGRGPRAFWADHRPELTVFAAFAALVAAMPWIGQVPAILAFAAVYLLVWGRFRLPAVALYLGGLGLLLYVLYHRLLHTPFLPAPWLAALGL